jgi:hydrogenase expression/formation protein HypC
MCIGVPGEIVGIVDPAEQRVVVAVGGAQREVSAALLGVRDGAGNVTGGGGGADEAVGVGDWVAVHMGFAMEKLEESEAREVLRSIAELQSDYERALTEPRVGGEEPGAA